MGQTSHDQVTGSRTLPVLTQERSRRGSNALFDGTLAAATLSLLVALVTLGIIVRRARILGRPWSTLPLGLGILFVPLLLAGGLLSLAGEPLLEVPIVVLGLGWIVLGYATASGVRAAGTRGLAANR